MGHIAFKWSSAGRLRNTAHTDQYHGPSLGTNMVMDSLTLTNVSIQAAVIRGLNSPILFVEL